MRPSESNPNAGAAQVANELTPEFKRAAVAVANMFRLSQADAWESLPETLREYFSLSDYNTLVTPLVHRDRARMSWSALAVKYRLSVREVRTICQKAYYRANIKAVEK